MSILNTGFSNFVLSCKVCDMENNAVASMTILEKLKDPNTIHTLSFMEKLEGSLFVTVLGVGITFVVLILIKYLTELLSFTAMKIENSKKVEVKEIEKNDINTIVEEKSATIDEDDELRAVISAAIAASLNTTIHNIVVKNITRVEDTTPTWGQIGRMEQLNRGFNK